MAALGTRWNEYWSAHHRLRHWHAATTQRRTGPCDGGAMSDAAPRAEPTTAGRVVVETTTGPGGCSDVTRLVGIVAKLAVVTDLSYTAPYTPAVALQFANAAAAQRVAATLGELANLGVARAPSVALRAGAVRLKGPGLSAIVGCDPQLLLALFEVFGPCQPFLEAVDSESTTAVLRVTYTDGELAERDGVAALAALQQPLAADWGVCATLVRATAEAVLQPLPRCKEDLAGGVCTVRGGPDGPTHCREFSHSCDPGRCQWRKPHKKWNAKHERAFFHSEI
jgi:hypothetical protein